MPTKCKRYLSPLAKARPILQGPRPLQTLSESITPREPTKRALLIAINYTNLSEDWRLKGPQREVEDLRDLLINQYQYKLELITILTDKAGTPETHFPSRKNILNHLRAFYDGQEPGDRYVFYFAGHAFQCKTMDKKEEDGKDEFILSAFDTESNLPGAGIVDDLLQEYLVKPLNDLSHLTAILDTCHSNTLLDLPHYRCNRVYSLKSLYRRAKRRCFEMYVSLQNQELFQESIMHNLLERMMHPTDQIWFCNGSRFECCRRKDIENNVICLSACKDSEEVVEHSQLLSMTNKLIKALRENPHPTLKKLMLILSTHKGKLGIKGGFPQLSSLHPAVCLFSQ